MSRFDNTIRLWCELYSTGVIEACAEVWGGWSTVQYRRDRGLSKHGAAMNQSTLQHIRPNVSASSSFGSALIFLQDEPWYYNRNRTKDSGNVNTSSSDGVEAHSLPGFADNARAVVTVYCVLFSVAAIGNLSVFLTLLRARHRKSRVSLLMTHLAAADLIVTFVMIPLEVGWRITTQWLAGNAACKLFLFLRAFGLYLSSNILVCISLDRYFAIIYPLKVSDARRRSKLMLCFAWFTSLLCSVPQVCIIVLYWWAGHCCSMHCDFFKIYCAPPNLDNTRTWICRLNFAQRFFNEPEISDSGPPA